MHNKRCEKYWEIILEIMCTVTIYWTIKKKALTFYSTFTIWLDFWNVSYAYQGIYLIKNTVKT